MVKVREQAVFVCALGVALLGVARLPSVNLVWVFPAGRIVLETTAGLIAGLTAFLVFLRYRRSSAVADLILVYAFTVLALGNLLASILPGVLVIADSAEVAGRLQLIAGVVGGLSLALVALARQRPGLRASPAAAVAAAAAGPLLAGTLTAVVHEGAIRPVLHLAAACLFGVTALGFVRESDARSDAFSGPVGVGACLAVISRVLYSFEPDYGLRSVHMGDLVRLGFYLLLLVGATREIRGYWRGVGISEERRRLARELHDGLSQELAYIATQARREPDAIGLYRIAAAAERALDESRRAIAALTQNVDQPLDVAIAATSEDVAGRAGLRVELDLAAGVTVTPTVREGLLRIVREAVGNAARHAGASTIWVTLTSAPVCVRVRDDGRGFAPESLAEQARGFGLVSMRERAQSLGADLVLHSSPGAGTTVEVVLR